MYARKVNRIKIEGKYLFKAPVSQVWDVLLNPQNLAHCMPGCERLEPVGEDRYKAILSIGVPNIKGEYTGNITITDKNWPSSYRLLVEVNGGPGFVNGEALVSLTEEVKGTMVAIDGEGQVGGFIARVGQRLVGRVSTILMDRTFECLRKEAASG